jgi:hypothetical protein
MVVEIDVSDMGTCPAVAGRPPGRNSLRRRYIQRTSSRTSQINAGIITSTFLRAPRCKGCLASPKTTHPFEILATLGPKRLEAASTLKLLSLLKRTMW